MYRRQEGEWVGYILNTHIDEWIKNMVLGFGSIFSWRNVVGNNTYSNYTKMGGRIHRTIPLRMRLHTHIIVKTKHFYKCKKFILCKNTYTPQYVVITTKVKYDGATRTHAYTII